MVRDIWRFPVRRRSYRSVVKPHTVSTEKKRETATVTTHSRGGSGDSETAHGVYGTKRETATVTTHSRGSSGDGSTTYAYV